MNLNATKLIISAAAMLAMGSSISAQQQTTNNNCPPSTPACPPKPPACAPKPPSCSTPCDPMGLSKDYPAAYNAPAGIDVQCSWDVFVTGSFIYWDVAQEGMDIGLNNAIVPGAGAAGGTDIPQNSKYLFQKSTYEPGFKVGIGIDTDFDNWLGYAEYTWLHFTTTTNSGAAADPRGDTPVIQMSNWYVFPSYDFPDNVGASNISSKWNFRLDMVDAVISRPFYQGRMLTVSPYAGAKGAWIRQHLNIAATIVASPATATNPVILRTRSNSWGAGLEAGMKTNWLLGCGFRLESDMCSSLLYTSYTKVVHSETPSSAADGVLSASYRRYNTVRPMAELGLGIGWGSYFDRKNWYLDFSADYDFMFFWSQNMMRALVDDLVDGSAAAAGNLTMHGLTATVRFDF